MKIFFLFAFIWIPFIQVNAQDEIDGSDSKKIISENIKNEDESYQDKTDTVDLETSYHLSHTRLFIYHGVNIEIE